MRLPQGAVETNFKRARDEKIQNRILIPEEMLTAIKNRGQDGKPVLRGQKPATGK